MDADLSDLGNRPRDGDRKVGKLRTEMRQSKQLIAPSETEIDTDVEREPIGLKENPRIDN